MASKAFPAQVSLFFHLFPSHFVLPQPRAGLSATAYYSVEEAFPSPLGQISWKMDPADAAIQSSHPSRGSGLGAVRETPLPSRHTSAVAAQETLVVS